jgi:uncharacterized protein (TIGR02611 family)
MNMARRLGVGLAGVCVVVIGLVLPIPGTGIVLVPLGLAILGTEFLWAEKLNRFLGRLVRRPRLTLL